MRLNGNAATRRSIRLTRLLFTLCAMVATVHATHVAAQFPGGGLPRPGGSALSGAPSGAAAGLHRIHSADSLPGEVGGARLQRWGAVAGYYQPVAFRGPGSTAFSLGVDGVFQPPMPSQTPLHAGLLVGGVYRFRVTSIPGFEGEELFPTIEVIDRTYPPHHLAVRHPIPINLELDDLRDALSGRMVTRVIYLEDPTSAVPIDTTPESGITLDVPPYQDPLHVADTLGKPVAIIRIGSVTPPTPPSLMPQFFFGYPPWVRIDSPIENVSYDNGPSEQPQSESPSAP